MGNAGAVGYRQSPSIFGTATVHGFRFVKTGQGFHHQFNPKANLAAANDWYIGHAAYA